MRIGEDNVQTVSNHEKSNKAFLDIETTKSYFSSRQKDLTILDFRRRLQFGFVKQIERRHNLVFTYQGFIKTFSLTN